MTTSAEHDTLVLANDPFSEIPDHILIEIFIRTPISDWAQISCVRKHWATLFRGECLWQAALSRTYPNSSKVKKWPGPIPQRLGKRRYAALCVSKNILNLDGEIDEIVGHTYLFLKEQLELSFMAPPSGILHGTIIDQFITCGKSRDAAHELSSQIWLAVLDNLEENKQTFMLLKRLALEDDIFLPYPYSRSIKVQWRVFEKLFTDFRDCLSTEDYQEVLTFAKNRFQPIPSTWLGHLRWLCDISVSWVVYINQNVMRKKDERDIFVCCPISGYPSKTLMRRIKLKPLILSSTSHHHDHLHKKPSFHSPHNLNNIPPNTSSSIPTTNHRPIFTNSLPPPPEWIEPFYNISDLVGSSSPQDLKPSPWVTQILNLLNGSLDMESKLDTFCNNYLIKLSPNFVAYVIRCNELRQHSDVAYRFFTWAGNQRKYKHNFECYVSLIEVLALDNNNELDKVKILFNEFKELGFVVTVTGANSLIRSFGGVGMVEELLWVWRKMKENGIEPSLYTYNFLVNGLVNSMFIESAERVFEVMESGRIGPDVVTYNTMIKGYCKAGQTQKAMEKFRAMEERNVAPDKITYVTLMQACYGEGDYDRCLGLYQEMEDIGLEVPPHAYTLVIGGLCKIGKCAQGNVVFENMNRKGLKPNLPIYTALIDSYARCGNLGEAMDFFERMKKDGLEPDEVTYGVIINGLCKNGRVEEAMDWFKYCESNNMPINAVFYSSLIDGLGKAGRVDEAEKFFEDMIDKGCPRDSYCYNAIIDAFARGGKIDEALTIFNKMEDEKCDATVYTYTILITGLFKEHRNEDALKMWDMMIDKGITPTAASFRALSMGLCLSGKIARACKILDDLAAIGIIPETAFEDMINCLVKAGRVKEACKLADGFVDRGREIPGKIRTILLNALRKTGNADLAIKLMHSKIGIGYDRMGSVKRRVKFRSLVEN
ncbi:hypothetical protein ACFE04_031746 [Oxalis oulophora]